MDYPRGWTSKYIMLGTQHEKIQCPSNVLSLGAIWGNYCILDITERGLTLNPRIGCWQCVERWFSGLGPLLGSMTVHASFLRDFRHVTWTDGGRIHEASKRMVPAGSSCSKQLDIAATKDQAPPSSELLWCPPSGNQTWWWETHY